MWIANDFECETLIGLVNKIASYHVDNDYSEPTVNALHYCNDYTDIVVNDIGIIQFQKELEETYEDLRERAAGEQDYYNETAGSYFGGRNVY